MLYEVITIAAMGIISALGTGTDSTCQALKRGESGLASVDFFQLNRPDFPKVGMVPGTIKNTLPRTHELARIAAGQIMAQCSLVPDAVVLGVTTGGIRITSYNVCYTKLLRLGQPFPIVSMAEPSSKFRPYDLTKILGI